MKILDVELEDDTYNYLEFLERMRFIRSKEEAINKALTSSRSFQCTIG